MMSTDRCWSHPSCMGRKGLSFGQCIVLHAIPWNTSLEIQLTERSWHKEGTCCSALILTLSNQRVSPLTPITEKIAQVPRAMTSWVILPEKKKKRCQLLSKAISIIYEGNTCALDPGLTPWTHFTSQPQSCPALNSKEVCIWLQLQKQQLRLRIVCFFK